MAKASANGTAKGSGFRPKKRGQRRLPDLVSQVTRRAFQVRGFRDSRLLSAWADIVGPHLAAGTQPEKITRSRGEDGAAVLTLRVAPALAPEVQHLEPLILEKLNGYFGFAAIQSLRLIQAPLSAADPVSQQAPRPSSDPAADPGADDAALEDIADNRLRRALGDLGRQVRAADKSARGKLQQ